MNFFSLSANAVPMNSAFNQLPTRFHSNELSTGSRALGEICYSRDLMPDGTVCNPAFLDQPLPGSLLVKGFVGNGYAAFNSAHNLIFNPIEKEDLQRLFQKEPVTAVEGSAGLFFVARHMTVEFSPYRLQYLSEVHNPSFPVLALHASVEQRIGFGLGTNLDFVRKDFEEISVGLGLRLLKRDYIHSTFSLLQTAIQPPRTLLPVKSQKAAYLDPSVALSKTRWKWPSRFSLAVRNLGWRSIEEPLFKEDQELIAGVMTEPELGPGTLRLGLDVVRVNLSGYEFSERFRTGVGYRYGLMEIMAGANAEAFAFGFQFGIKALEAGITYEFVRSDLPSRAKAVDRIATEVGLRL